MYQFIRPCHHQLSFKDWAVRHEDLSEENLKRSPEVSTENLFHTNTSIVL